MSIRAKFNSVFGFKALDAATAGLFLSSSKWVSGFSGWPSSDAILATLRAGHAAHSMLSTSAGRQCWQHAAVEVLQYKAASFT